LSAMPFAATLEPGFNVATRYGSWQVHKGNYAISMPWPELDASPAWKSVVNGATLDTLTGELGAEIYHPLWLTTLFAYEHQTEG